MSRRDPEQILLEVFYRLRRGSFALGIGELLAALQAVDGGWGRDEPALRQMARLLWCHSPPEIAEFEEIFTAVLAATTLPAGEPASPGLPIETLPPGEEPSVESPPATPPTEPLQQEIGLTVLPVPVSSLPTPVEAGAELRAYWPMSRRSMVYTWRYLRRPLKDGPRDVLDVEATVECTARQDFFLYPVYDRRENNYAHLVLFVDQGGSMAPFHRFTRDLVETASEEEESKIRQVEVAYFHNVPPAHVWRDPHLTQSLPLKDLLDGVSADSSVLIVSDGGAARGYRDKIRIRATAEFLARLKRRTTLIAWLNPMPQPRWASTSAQFIAGLVPMFQMDRDGFSNAIDALRGQLPYPHR